MLRQPGFHPRLLRIIQPHAQLGTPPDGVFQLDHPLFLYQIAQFGFIQAVAKLFAQIARPLAFARISSLWLP